MPPQPVTGIAILLSVDDIRTSQEVSLWASTACHWNSFTIYMKTIFVPHEKTPTGLHCLLQR
jgi:hypothetical protein